jgi:glycerol-3-phosphate acyltransferase PlsY
MEIGKLLVVILLGYLFGSFPSGYVLMRAFRGQDVRQIGSGRTGSTNVFRAGGAGIGFFTGVLDALKAAAAVWVAQAVLGSAALLHWGEVLAGLGAVLGHIYPIFLGFKGGAGGAPTLGAAFALWPWALAFILPIGFAVWYGIGYASLTTIAFCVVTIGLMAYRWLTGAGPIEYVIYGILALAACLWTLRPNLQRLARGEERVVGWRAKRLKEQGRSNPPRREG